MRRREAGGRGADTRPPRYHAAAAAATAMARSPRQVDHEARAVVVVGDEDAALVRLHGEAAEVQADPAIGAAASAALAAHALVLLEDALAFALGDARARVEDLEADG